MIPLKSKKKNEKKKIINKINISEPLVLDSGKILEEYEIAYETFWCFK